MKAYFRNFRVSMFIIAVLCLLLGVALLVWPDISMNVLAYGFGGILTLSGLIQIGGYIAGERAGFLRKLQMLAGILIAVVGIAILLLPSTVMKLTIIVMGIVMLYHGIMDIKYGFDIQKMKGKLWGLTLLFGLATCAMGVLVLVDPFKTAKVLMIIIGVGLIFDGLSDIVTVATVAHVKKTFELLNTTEIIEVEPAAGENLEEVRDEPAEETGTPDSTETDK